MLRQLEGIVLRSRDYGETHKIITIYTKQVGKITALCRGANKPKSRLSAVSQPFIYGDFQAYMPKGLSTVQQASVLQSFRKIREDIEKTAYASYIVELLEKFTEEKERDVFLFKELLLTLTWINDHDAYFIPIMMFELKMFEKGGFKPVLDYCMQCGEKEGPFAFSIQEGGVLCVRCQSVDPYAITLNKALQKLLPVLQSVSLERVGNISVKEENILMMRRLLDAYYDRFGSYTLKSKRFLEQLDKLK